MLQPQKLSKSYKNPNLGPLRVLISIDTNIGKATFDKFFKQHAGYTLLYVKSSMTINRVVITP
jgi:hypothetical protein